MRKQEQGKCADVYPMSILNTADEYIPGMSLNCNHRNSRYSMRPSRRENLLCTGSITSSGQVTGSSLRITGLATVGNSCSPNGQIFIDTTGSLLVCVSGVVTKHGSSSPKWGTPISFTVGITDIEAGFIAPAEGVAVVTSKPVGYAACFLWVNKVLIAKTGVGTDSYGYMSTMTVPASAGTKVSAMGDCSIGFFIPFI